MTFHVRPRNWAFKPEQAVPVRQRISPWELTPEMLSYKRAAAKVSKFEHSRFGKGKASPAEEIQFEKLKAACNRAWAKVAKTDPRYRNDNKRDPRVGVAP